MPIDFEQDFEKLTYKKRGDSEDLDQFLYGLQADLQHPVRAGNPKTLVEAITEAVRVEQKTGARRVGTQSGYISAEGILTELMEKYPKLKDDNQLEATIRRAPAKARCGVCGMDNHPEDRCQYKDAQMKLYIFCQKEGHQYGDCYALQRVLENGEFTLGNVEKPGGTPSLSPPLLPQVVYTTYPIGTVPPVMYPAASYTAQTTNGHMQGDPRERNKQGPRNYESRPDPYPNGDPDNRRNNRDSRINWRPEYRENNYRNQGGRDSRTRYRPYFSENAGDDCTNHYQPGRYQDRNEDRRCNHRSDARRYDSGQSSTRDNLNNDEPNRENATGHLNFQDARR